MRNFLILLLCLFPALILDGDIKIEGRVFTETSPIKGAKFFVYKSYEDINSGIPLLTSEPTDEQGLYKFQLPSGEYYFTAKGNMNGKEFYAYHGNNPIKVDPQNLWLAFMSNEIKEPVYSEGTASIRGRCVLPISLSLPPICTFTQYLKVDGGNDNRRAASGNDMPPSNTIFAAFSRNSFV
jgi:hypothetical protein